MSVARQVDYDALFAELVAGGMRAEEAAAETHETFLESNYDTSGMFAYRTEEEHGLKCALMDKVNRTDVQRARAEHLSL